MPGITAELWPFLGKTLVEYAEQYSELNFRVVAISRKGLTIIPSGSVKIQSTDQIFVLAKTETIPDIIKTIGKPDVEINRIMIAGGTPIGAMIARILCHEERNYNIKLIEPDYDIAVTLAEDLLVTGG